LPAGKKSGDLRFRKPLSDYTLAGQNAIPASCARKPLKTNREYSCKPPDEITQDYRFISVEDSRS
jgi:hypothetical protein